MPWTSRKRPCLEGGTLSKLWYGCASFQGNTARMLSTPERTIRLISCSRFEMFGSSAGPSTTIPTKPGGTERRASALDAAAAAAAAHSATRHAMRVRRRMWLPCSGLDERAPGRVAALPELVEEECVLVRVHAVPEALVTVCVELPRARHRLERAAFQNVVRTDEAERGRLHHAEAAVHPAVEPGLLLEPGDAPVVAQLRDAPGVARAHDRHRRRPAVGAVEVDQRAHVE